jgi:hypothetical protein
VGGTLGLIDLAFGFQVFATGELTGAFFDGALCLVGSALHVFAIHDRVPGMQIDSDARAKFVAKTLLGLG